MREFLLHELVFRLRFAVRRIRPEIWTTNWWFLLHDNAPAHRSVLVKDFLAKNKATTLEHPPCSTDLAAADSYLFLRLKSALKGQRCCDVTDFIKNVTAEMKWLSQNGFQLRFQHLSVAGRNVYLYKWTFWKKIYVK
jgi:hypothetical protein